MKSDLADRGPELKAERLVYLMLFKKKNARFGKYPSCDMLNNAIRFIHAGDTESALMEIIYAIEKADGYFYEDVKPVVEEVKRRRWEQHPPE